ncbi:SRPBCC domain-containing protein [Parvicella tangerina]|uniref:SRPBCC domain-containing protein n=1 Tax=Parvicella tangerina TaxID=2829795 RepID=A0A916JMF2_9FLAO|nr:SRPBCC domain-containing protein [Parvicella tangerina]CAG5080682.1 hypothetical protein CRYO30217_01417 [Parvicella tangerina]
MKAEILTEIQINASPERVWEILTKTEDYPNWNPFVKSVTGQLKKGEKITVKLLGMTFKPVVQEVNVNQSFSWIGKLGVKGIFDGHHQFELAPNNAGTLFIHKEYFNGLLTKWFMRKKADETKAAFEAMNNALKLRAESN